MSTKQRPQFCLEEEKAIPDAMLKGRPKGVYISWIKVLMTTLSLTVIFVGAVLLVYYVPRENCENNVPISEPKQPVFEESDQIGTTFDGRLPGNLLPIQYNVRLQPYLDEEDGSKRWTLDGRVEILVLCQATTRSIVLHAAWERIKAITAFEVTYNNGSSSVQLKTGVKDLEKEFYTVNTTAEYLVKSIMYKISFNFSSDLGKWDGDLRGLYVSNYEINGQTRYVAATFLEPNSARKVFPCFDEPEYKAKFNTILVYRNKTRHALSNTKIIKKIALEEDWVEDTFGITVNMSTYLFAMVISDYECLQNVTSNNIVFRVCAREDLIENARYSLDIAASMLPYFETYFNSSYPFSKMDMVVVDDNRAGAMENWGLIIYKEEYMIYNPKEDTSGKKLSVAQIVSHEIAHQWFGNIVTPQWWSGLWLSEGFATYFESLGVLYVDDPKDPLYYMVEHFVREKTYPALLADSVGTSHPIVTEVGNTSEIYTLFDTITYSKGAAIIRMMNEFLGNETMVEGLRDYLDRYRYGNTDTNDLWDSLMEASAGHNDYNIKEIMDTWTLQMGYPVISFTREGEATLHVTQSHFLLNPFDKPSSNYEDLGYKWHVPITYSTQTMMESNQVKLVWLTPDESEIIIDASPYMNWILMNINQTGFYRVNYDYDNWFYLKFQLLRNHTKIPVVNRAAILDDSLNLGKSQLLQHTIALELTEYLINETEFLPWSAFTESLGYTKSMLSRTEYIDEYKTYVSNQITPLYQSLGWELTMPPSNDYFKRIIAIKTACEHDLRDCVLASIEQYRTWMLNPNINPIQTELRRTVYCTAIRNGGDSEWNFAYEIYKKNTESNEKSTLLYALACTKLSWKLQQLIDDTLYSSKDTIEILGFVAENSAQGYSLAWQSIFENFDDLETEFGLDEAYNLVWKITEKMNTNYDLILLEEFGTLHYDMPPSAAKNFYRALDQVSSNINWLTNNIYGISSWLEEMVRSAEEGKCNNEIPEFEGRLPNSIRPTNYHVHLKVYLDEEDCEKQYTYEGQVSINIVCGEPYTDVIKVHVDWDRLDITESSLTSISSTGDTIEHVFVNTEKDHTYEFYVIQLDKYLNVDGSYILNLNFTGKLGYSDGSLTGLYLSDYEIASETRYVALTHMEPTHARKFIPCFDEPNLKATFDFSVAHRSRRWAMFNSPLVTSEEEEDWVVDVFKKTAPTPTYLLALVISDFACLNTTTENNILMRVCARPDMSEHLSVALEYGSEILTFYENWLGVDYPLPKLDMVGFEEFLIGGMENYGLILYREIYLIFREGIDTPKVKQRIATLIAHEIAHLWFGDLVTPKWWEDAYLKEGTASYVEYLAVRDIDKNDTFFIDDHFVTADMIPALVADSSGSSHPLSADVGWSADIADHFDTVTYRKGSSVLRMMDHFLGHETYTTGCYQYLMSHYFGNADGNDLWAAMDNAEISGQIDVKNIMDTWTLQMGYPVVKLYRQGKMLNIIQQHFLLDPQDSPSDNYMDLGYKWHIPLTYKYKSNANSSQLVWMNNSDINMVINELREEDWIIANVDRMGFYRVNYHADGWQRLIDQLHEDHEALLVRDRAGMIDDAFNLGRGLHLDTVIALKVAQYLDDETRYIPWQATLDNLEYTTHMLQRTSSYGDYMKYLQHLVSWLYDTYGKFSPLDSYEDYMNGFVALQIACNYGLASCVETAKEDFSKWMEDPSNNTIPVDGREHVYCAALRYGGDDEFTFAWKQYLDDNDTSDDYELRYAMGCSSSQWWLLLRYLEYSFEGLKSTSVVQYQIKYISHNSALGFSLAWDYVKNNFNHLLELIGDSAYTVAWDFSDLMNTDIDLKELKQLGEIYKTQMPCNALEGFELAKRKVENNIAWMDRNYEDIKHWLKIRD